MVKIYHNSQQPAYRSPFGAVAVRTQVRLSLSVSEAKGTCRASIRFWTEKGGEVYYPMQLTKGSNDILWFSFEFRAPDEPQLVWYSFVVGENDELHRYGNNMQNLGGEGQVYREDPPSFQITVYHLHEVPGWYRDAIVYQIFPDRYYRGADWQQRMADSFRSPDWKGPHCIIRQDWNDRPGYLKNSEGAVTHWDFFGGTLEGIREKLGYLESMGISAIYLNPIFAALSNHRYDTSDYRKIDARLGDEDSFSALCRDAKAHGISIILDGVFNHSGCDSIYFDKYGNYGGHGAWGNPASPYAAWYKFTNPGHTDYDCWWGAKDLPAFDKENPEYRELIYRGEDAVVRHWMQIGARGWRLDVADELPDDFIKGIKAAVTETDPEGLLIGEVWEDASHKVSYGKMRSYLLGDELDGVMNYPFRDAFLGFLIGKYSAEDVRRITMSLYENYPPQNYYASLNLIGSHDRIRILTILGLNLTEEAACSEHLPNTALTARQRELAVRKLRLLVSIQMTFPGVPCIYYGDELGMEGGPDPYNRAPYPWFDGDRQIFNMYRTMIALRKEWRVLVDGDFTPVAYGDNVIGYWRKNQKDQVLVLINRDLAQEETISVDSCDSIVLDLFSAETYRVINGRAEVKLPALGAVALLLRENPADTVPLLRGAGILCHITSLPSDWGIGQMDNSARQFIKQMAEAGQSYWQILPLNPCDCWNSPYATSSAFAGNELLINPDDLVRRGLLSAESAEAAQKQLCAHGGNPEFSAVAEVKTKLLREAYSHFIPDDAYFTFYAGNVFWLRDYCLYRVLKDRFQNVSWQEWPAQYRERNIPAAEIPQLEKESGFYAFCQYVFAEQWRSLRKYANAKQLRIIGDLPFYVSEDSADVWAHQELFCLDIKGCKSESAGVPPDYFCENGQYWNTPVYRWDRMKEEGYLWWIQRLKQAQERYDFIRLDHFRGFEQYWSIPVGEKASAGRWRTGPGCDLFNAVKQQLGELPLIAEDLGEITVPVKDLMLAYGFPGMDVFQFSADKCMSKDKYPDRETAVLYSGTHDNQTLLGWCAEHHSDCDCVKLAELIIRHLYESDAPVVVLPFQDILGLGDEARMNTPGTIQGNWQWRFSSGDFTQELRLRFKVMAAATDRMPVIDMPPSTEPDRR